MILDVGRWRREAACQILGCILRICEHLGHRKQAHIFCSSIPEVASITATWCFAEFYFDQHEYDISIAEITPDQLGIVLSEPFCSSNFYFDWLHSIKHWEWHDL